MIEDRYCELVEKGRTRELLDLLNNCVPFPRDCGLEVASLTRREDGSITSSRWRPWRVVRDDDRLARRVNQRSISTVEIVLDIDPDLGEPAHHFRRRVLQAIRQARQDFRFLGAYTTGSRGVHIHLLEPRLLHLDKRRRELVKAEILRFYGADPAKKAERCLILVEGCANPKTGRPKLDFFRDEVTVWTGIKAQPAG